MRPGITRRQWLAGNAAAAAGWLSDRPLCPERLGTDTYQVYFGDLHNHNSVGYAKGSLERTFEIAQNHLRRAMTDRLTCLGRIDRGTKLHEHRAAEFP